jgi:RND family efflux transporter MFP subunit
MQLKYKKQNQMAHTKQILKTSLCCSLLLLFFTACNSFEDSPKSSYKKLVKTVTVKESSATKNKQFPGTIEEAEEINLAFRVAGPIAKIHVKEGQFVEKGQLIAEIDTRDYVVQKTAIETQVKQLQSEYSRIAELNKRKSVADNDYEKMKAGKEMAEAKLKNANDQLKDTKLYAPFSGYITKIMFETGELVNHGTPIAKLIDVSLFKVEIDVPANMYINKDNITNIECSQENIPNKTFKLTLFSNNVKANNNGLYKLYLYHTPEKDTKLAPGMNVLVNVSYSTQDSVLLRIPIEAIFTKDEANYVWLLKDSIVASQEITTNNIVQNGTIGILSGLKAKEEIVVGGLHLLNEGEVVKKLAPQSKTNIGNIL